ncbi:copper amine oxidase N-terminal domain-containing protein [Paenibacillus woosongensis]|uniref:Copper amine oxidase N-terminal domain-containing protein n=1 Tax=Paenibacillus woosongensis TaxID=307580 RepID=A0A7X2Z5D8_9BACL|nr:copper amine oxidase N-terminal domain-containing protein [Paenibacillus woosongensis]MUG47844.1 copper amine oxidase N-terminal domain-containing protein [Paenibacillus woosongensis]
MRKWLVCTLAIMLSVAALTPSIYASGVRVSVDGRNVQFLDEHPYVDQRFNLTMVPLAFISDKLGAATEWDGKLKQITISLNRDTVILVIGDHHALVNGKRVDFDGAAVLKNGRTMVPLRFISEALHANVEWQPKHKLVSIMSSVGNVPKGTWIWDTHFIKQDQEKMISFAKMKGVTSIYLQVNRDIDSMIYEEFIRKAKREGILVEALEGRPEWVYKSGQEDIQKFIEWVKTYNSSVGPEASFTGLHFDIEPYALDEWTKVNKVILESWMDNLRLIEKETKGSGLQITMDVPYWLNTVHVPGTNYSMSAWLLEKFDCLVIMNYRNHALGDNGIVENAQDMLREASTLKKKIVIAVETVKSKEGPRVSFYSMSNEVMEKELQSAHNKLASYESYAGFAIHDFKGWQDMK